MRDAYQQGDLAALWERALALGEQRLELSLVRTRQEPCNPGCLLAHTAMIQNRVESIIALPPCLPSPWAS